MLSRRSRIFVPSAVASAILVVCLLSTTHAAEWPNKIDSVSTNCYWMNLGFGGGSFPGFLSNDNGGFSGGISWHYKHGKHLFSIRYVQTEEFQLALFDYFGPPAKVWDIGLLYGRMAKSRIGMASLSTGLSLVGARYGYFSASRRIGLPIDGQLFWTPSKFAGIGLNGFINLNHQMSYWGFLICLQIGKLR